MSTGIIHRSKYLYYCSIGILSFIIRKVIFSFFHKFNKYHVKHKSIAVCGRGLSSNKFFQNDHHFHTKLFIANYSDIDLSINDYFKFIDKDLVIVCDISEVMPNIFLMYLIKISEIIIARPNSQLKKPFKRSARNSYRLNLLGVKVRGIKSSNYLDIYDSNKNLIDIGTGLYTIYEAAEFAMRNDIKKVYLYGFDFYIGPKNKLTLLRDDFESEEQYLSHRANNIHLSESLEYLIEKYPKITFVNNTFNTYNFKSKNMEILLPSNI